jgi:hypothetical protein
MRVQGETSTGSPCRDFEMVRDEGRRSAAPRYRDLPVLILSWPSNHLLPIRHGNLYYLRERLSRSAIS